jgi:putative ABC transport system permease protein
MACGNAGWGDPQLPGKTIEINGKAFTVIGVLPANFDLFGTSRSYNLWMPFALDAAAVRRDDHSIMVFARVKDELTLAQAQSEIDGVMRQLAAEHPQASPNTSVHLAQFEQEQTSRVKPLLIILALTTGVVLLIACANVANRTLAQVTTREHEVATRFALGATRWRLARQLLAESVLLALIGGSANLGFSYFGLQAARAILPTSGAQSVPYVHFIRMDGLVLGVALAGSALTGIIFGLVPAFQITRGSSQGVKTHFGRSGTGQQQGHVRALLSGSQAALSVVLLLAAALLIRSFLNVLREDLGFDSRNVVTMQVWLPQSSYPEEAQLRNFGKEALPRVAVLPGVQSVSAINFLPLSGWGDSVDFDYSGHRLAVTMTGCKPNTALWPQTISAPWGCRCSKDALWSMRTTSRRPHSHGDQCKSGPALLA